MFTRIKVCLQAAYALLYLAIAFIELDALWPVTVVQTLEGRLGLVLVLVVSTAFALLAAFAWDLIADEECEENRRVH